MKEQQESKILNELKEAVGPVIDKIEHEIDSPHAAFVIAAKEMTDKKGEYSGIQTFVDICGDYGIIGEALVNELTSQIEEGKPALFNLLREVVKVVEEELELKEDEQLPEGNNTLH